MAVYNCDCEDTDPGRPAQTRAELRRRMAIRCGFAANASNLPPGQTDEFNEYLLAAQNFLYDKLASYKIARFYRWPLVAGERFYDIGSNAERFDDGVNPVECAAIFSPDHLLWVGVSRGGATPEGPHDDYDAGAEWYKLYAGINPELYSGGIQESWPARYEIRQCIEIWPAPASDGGFLRIKAQMALMPFAADTDKSTIDAETVLMQAIATWRTDKGKPGARELTNMVISRLGDLAAGTHLTKRYIPGCWPEPSPPRPTMVDGFIE